MAQPLDLQEQEQLDALKSFWKSYGSLITWALVAALAVYAGINGWRYWQRDQAAKAAAMFGQLEQAAQAGDAQRSGQIFDDLKERYARTAYAEQAGLLAARVQFDRGQADAAKASLAWVADHAGEDEYRSVARLRLAALLLQAGDFDGALKQLDAAKSPPFAALVADRRGDVLLAQGKPAEARAAYQAAWQAMDEKVEYRQLIDAKLTALGAAPATAAKASEAAK
ncbi:MAG TPA: tetratricopeptide repeat protein [Rubrivivax sp.]|mgnify:CR=1 FL=1|nr:tetratricopeptide repeat protein [Rubrivivax sp.]